MKVVPSTERTATASDNETGDDVTVPVISDLRMTASGGREASPMLHPSPSPHASNTAQQSSVIHTEGSLASEPHNDLPIAMPAIQYDTREAANDTEYAPGDHDNDADAAPLTRERMRSYSPPPPHATQDQDRYKATGLALQLQFNDVVAGLYNITINSTLAERHDQERMRNMIAEVQAMIPTWQEAIGQRGAGAAQRR